MKKNYFIFTIAVVAMAIFIFVRLNCDKSNIKSVIIDNQTFSVELAQTAPQRETGLMNRDHLNINSGMLFVFPKEDIYQFWMKNTLIPLDIIWMNDGKIVDIKTLDPQMNENIPEYTPQAKASYVLEINAGLAAQYGFKIGDKVKFSTK